MHFPEQIQVIYEQIKEEIINGVYSGGQPLLEIPLAKKYDINRTRIRQVIQKLENESLIERIPNKGAFVKSITHQDLQEIFEIREALEGEAAKLAARRRNDQDLDEILDFFEKANKHPSRFNAEDKEKIGEKLHEFVLRACQNKRILHSMEPLKIQLRRIWNNGIRIPGRMDKAFSEHIDILRAIKKKDEVLAERKMKVHISKSFRDYVSAMIFK